MWGPPDAKTMPFAMESVEAKPLMVWRVGSEGTYTVVRRPKTLMSLVAFSGLADPG